MNYQEIWIFIQQRFQKNQPVALMIVAENTSGSPGRKGFKMAVASDGSSCGTIGGGIMEYKLVQKACELLQTGKKEICYIPQVHQKNASPHQSGMICAGSQVILLYTLYPSDLRIFDNLLSSFTSKSQEDFALVAGASGLQIVKGHNDEGLQVNGDKDWVYQENIGPSMFVYIVGGGHVGFAVSQVLSMLDVHVTVFDHRGDLETVRNNPYCHRMVVGPYDEIGQYIVEGENSYGLVVSTSFKTDEAGLRQLLPKRLRYLGVMGSYAKIQQIMENLRSSGFSSEDLKKVRAPIGLEIKSRTAAEIGISIAAELVQEKNSRTSIPLKIMLPDTVESASMQSFQ